MVGPQTFERERRGEQLHVGGGLEQAIGIARIKDVAGSRIHDMDAPMGLLGFGRCEELVDFLFEWADEEEQG